MIQFDQTYEDYLLSLGRENTDQRMTDAQFVVQEIHRFWRSKRCRDMMDGDLYYRGRHAILHKQRTAIGENGELITLDNLPNSRIVDNQFRKLVDQKANYLVGQPFVIRSEDQAFVDALRPYLLTKKFARLIKAVTRDALCCGIGWLFPYYDENGALAFRRLRPYEVIPLWADEEHTRLDAAIRVYDMTEYVGLTEKIVHRVEVYDDTGIHYFTLSGGSLTPVEPFSAPYIMAGEQAYNWERIPLIAFKYNADETPLLTRCRSMQDGLNASGRTRCRRIRATPSWCWSTTTAKTSVSSAETLQPTVQLRFVRTARAAVTCVPCKSRSTPRIIRRWSRSSKKRLSRTAWATMPRTTGSAAMPTR